jgi:hypothetical protein
MVVKKTYLPQYVATGSPDVTGQSPGLPHGVLRQVAASRVGTTRTIDRIVDVAGGILVGRGCAYRSVLRNLPDLPRPSGHLVRSGASNLVASVDGVGSATRNRGGTILKHLVIQTTGEIASPVGITKGSAADPCFPGAAQVITHVAAKLVDELPQPLVVHNLIGLSQIVAHPFDHLPHCSANVGEVSPLGEPLKDVSNLSIGCLLGNVIRPAQSLGENLVAFVHPLCHRLIKGCGGCPARETPSHGLTGSVKSSGYAVASQWDASGVRTKRAKVDADVAAQAAVFNLVPLRF